MRPNVFFFAASVDGSIHQVDLFSQREDRFTAAVGGRGAADPMRLGDESGSTDPTKKRLISVGYVPGRNRSHNR